MNKTYARYKRNILLGISIVVITISYILIQQSLEKKNNIVDSSKPLLLANPIILNTEMQMVEEVKLQQENVGHQQMLKAEAQQFFRLVSTQQVECQLIKRFGNKGDGGWNVCLSSVYNLKFNNCLVYSFGINYDFSFDDAISRAGCDVRSFDPSMPIPNHKRSERINFFAIGVDGVNGKNVVSQWTTRTIGALMEQLGDQNRIIDYLKIDVEYSEWVSMRAAMTENVLARTKQLGMEVHTREVLKKSSGAEHFHMYNRILADLYEQGFRLFSDHSNVFGLTNFRDPSFNGRSCCYELIFVNINFQTARPYGVPPLNVNVKNLPPIEIPKIIIPDLNSQENLVTKSQLASPVTLPLVEASNGLFTFMANRSLNHSYHLIALTLTKFIDLTKVSLDILESSVESFLQKTDVQCQSHVQIGPAEAGWDVCLATPFHLMANNCLVYSFGIHKDWKFADEISTEYGCIVKAYDPRIKWNKHNQSLTIQFHNESIGSIDGRNTNSWNISTFETILATNKDEAQVIDILKINMEYFSWDVLQNLLSNDRLIYNVKQLIFEIRKNDSLNSQKGPSLLSLHYWKLLSQLESLGFARWHSHPNSFGKYRSRSLGYTVPCCYKLSFINLNFMLN